VRVVGNRDSSVGIMTRQRVGRSDDRILAGAKDFFLNSKSSKQAVVATQPLSFPGVKRSGPDVDGSPRSSAEIKNE
jgi:hypothetical protein